MTDRGNDTTTAGRDPVRAVSRSSGYVAFQTLAGLAALGVLLQGLWAGIFLAAEHRRDKGVNVHARGAEVTIGVTVVAFLAALLWLRDRKDLVIGAAALAVALIVEAYPGGRTTDDGNTVTAVHVPLGMAVTVLAVWLPLRARAGRSRSSIR